MSRVEVAGVGHFDWSGDGVEPVAPPRYWDSSESHRGWLTPEGDAFTTGAEYEHGDAAWCAFTGPNDGPDDELYLDLAYKAGNVAFYSYTAADFPEEEAQHGFRFTVDPTPAQIAWLRQFRAKRRTAIWERIGSHEGRRAPTWGSTIDELEEYIRDGWAAKPAAAKAKRKNPPRVWRRRAR